MKTASLIRRVSELRPRGTFCGQLLVVVGAALAVRLAHLRDCGETGLEAECRDW